MPLFTTDFDGVVRPQGSTWDIGAYEYGGGGTPDTTAPTGSISAPSNGATLAGSVTVTCTATDDVGVANVQLYLDSAPLGGPITSISSSFSLPWNTATTTNGPHTISAVVTDFAGNTFTTSTITVTVLNSTPAPPDIPPTPTPPPIVVPQAVIVIEPIPLGALFYNTLGEFSTFIAQSVFPSESDPDVVPFTDDWIDVVRDLGVTGVGDETAKIQQALDQARANVLAGSGRTRVLVPSSVIANIAPVEDDLCDGTYYGPVGVCLWIDSGVHFRVNGTLRVLFASIQNYPNGQITVLEARNSFVGDIDSGDHDIVIDGTGTIDLEGIYDTNGEFTEDETEDAAKQAKSLWALRAYKVSKLTVKDLTIAHGIGEKFQIGFSSYVNFDNVKFDTALKYAVSNDRDTALINLDVCRGVHVTGCYSKNCSVFRGAACWASTEVTIDGNNISDLTGATGAEADEPADVGLSRVWDGSVSNYIKLTGQGLFNNPSCQCAWIEPASIGVLGTILGNRYDSGYSMRITASNELELFWSTEPLVAGNWTDYSLKVPLTTAGGAPSNFLVAGTPLFVCINITFSGAPVIADFYAGFTPGSVQLVGTRSGGHAIAPNGSVACGIGINMYGLTPQHAFNGKIARVAVIARALTASEIRAFAACGALPPDTNVAVTRFFLEITGASPEPNNYGTSIPGTVVGTLPTDDGLCGNLDDLVTPGMGNAVWFTDYGMEFVEKDMAFDQDIYDLAAGLDARLTITDNIFCRNGSDGIRILGAAQQGALTEGVTIQDNVVCSNGASGILIDGLKDFIISDNQIKNNGHGYPLQFD